MDKQVPLWKKIVGVGAFGAQYFLIAMVIGSYLVYQQGMRDRNLEMVLGSTSIMFLLVLAEFPFVFVRWLLKWTVSRGTFAVLAVQVAVGSFYRAVYHGYNNEAFQMQAFSALCLGASALFLYFMYRNVLHVMAIWRQKRRP